MLKKFNLLVGGFLILLFSPGFSLLSTAQKTISGVVTGNDLKPIVGASITVKGTSVGTSTNNEGSYSIAVPAGKNAIVVSSVGYETREFDVTDSTSLNISLNPTTSNLNEIVVVGYTSQRKKDITGAVSVVNVAELKTQPTIDAASQLQGRASGVDVVQSGVPGAGATVRIRGLGSFNNNSPLYVIDGVQTGSISGLNPNDIESMQVLKDAASASIYGVRGSNGVIVVTTKKSRRKGVTVNYDGYYGVQDPGKGFDLLNAQETAELYFLSRRNSGQATTGSVFGNGSSPVLPDYLYYTGAPNNGVPIMNGDPGVADSLYELDYSRLGDPGYNPYIIVPTSKNGTNWYEEITRTAPIQSHNLTMSSSNEASRFMFSVNYFDQDAITKWQFYKRYTIRLNSEFNILKSLRLGENLQVFSSEGNSPANTPNDDNANNRENSVITQTYRPSSLIPVYTINGQDFAGTAGGTGFGTLGNAKNPVAQLYRNRNNRNNGVNLFGNIYAELDMWRHLTFRTSFGGTINTNNAFTYPFIEYEHVENQVNTTYAENFIRNNQWIWTNTLNYKNRFGKNDLSVLIGQEAQKSGGRQVIASAQNFYSYNYQPFINLSNGSVQNLGGSSYYTPTSTLSYFGKADYAFDGKYLLSATVRRDGSSKFLGENRWGTFPAFSLGWRISGEKFMQGVEWITDLKIRGSWGKMGNEAAVSAANAFTTFASNRQSSWYDITGTQNAPLEGFYLSFTGNTLGTWETSINTNIGFDATLFNGSTDVVLDWYEKKTEDLLYNPAGQAISGAVAANNPAFRNVGSMTNKGFDLMITNRAKLSKDFTLNTTLTLTTYNNKILSINGEQKFFDFNSPANEANRIGQNATRNFVGSSFNTFYGYQVIGLFQDSVEAKAWNQENAAAGRFKFADINNDKKIDANDRTIIGNPNPDFSFGLNLGAVYKSFDLTAFFYGVQGKDAFNFTRWWTDFSAGFPGGRSKRSLYESWLPDGSRPNATVPIAETVFNSGNASSSYYVENASYFRLRNLQLGYTLPRSVSDKAKLSRVRFYLQAANLFTITNYTGLNPEITSTDDRASSVDVGAYPTVRQYLLGANIGF
jgi:TonB-dependent starch-binding outer membrane protein SusC